MVRILRVVGAVGVLGILGIVAWLAMPAAADTLEPTWTVDKVRVVKSESRLYLLRADEVMATYPVVFGANPVGHKIREGDQRTPEGWYLLDYKNDESRFYRSIRISYPNAEDVYWARQRGVDPGQHIMIHGQNNAMPDGVTRTDNWTDGCIALSNQHMDELWAAIDLDTPIEIEP